MECLAQNIKILRKAKGLSQTELAKIIGLKAKSSLQAYECGRGIQPLDKLIKITEVFQVTLDGICFKDFSKLICEIKWREID